MKQFKCNRCDSIELLTWPENYKKGDHPVNAETGVDHECIRESNSSFLSTTARNAVIRFTSALGIRQNLGNPVRSVT